MNRHRALLVASLGVLMVAAGCGSGSGFNPNNVTVTVAPPTAATSTNGQVALQATVKGDVSPGLVLSWSIAENTSMTTTCFWNMGTTTPTGPCPGGTIEVPASDFGDYLTVTYFAPSTAGTYHVTAEWCLCGFGTTVIKTGSSVITVGP
jgi:hypothetical protein